MDNRIRAAWARGLRPDPEEGEDAAQRLDREDLERRPFRDAGAPLADLGEGHQRRLVELVTRTIAEPETAADNTEEAIVRRSLAIGAPLAREIALSGRDAPAIVRAAVNLVRAK